MRAEFSAEPALEMIRPQFLFLTSLLFATAVTSLNPRLADHVDWSPCEGHEDVTQLSCGFYTVPLDWTNLNDSDSRNATLFVAKYSAEPSKRIGTVFVNPGGPGASGADNVIAGGVIFLNRTGGLYDVVGWDPRGVGHTFPGLINCFNSSQEEAEYWKGTLLVDGIEAKGNFTAQDDIDRFYAQIPIFDARMATLKEQCMSTPAGQYMEYVGTLATVKDLVALADVLDGEGSQIHYLGYSYGTIIGTWLISVFPERAGRVILDGVVNPIFYGAEREDLIRAEYVESTDEAFQAFATGCELAGPRGCPLANDTLTAGQDIISWVQNLTDLAYDLKQRGLVEYGSSRIRSMIFHALYNNNDWATFSSTLAEFWQEYSAQAAAINLNYARDEYPTQLSTSYSLTAIRCGDSVDRGSTTTKDVFDEIVNVTQHISGYFGPMFDPAVHICHAWPWRAVERFQGPFNPTLETPALVIGNIADPVTPFKSARALADMLGSSGILIEDDGYGHSSDAQRSQCILNIVLEYFVNGTYPEGDNTFCQIDQDFEIFPLKGVTASDISEHLASGSRSRRPVAAVRQPMNLSPTEARVYYILCIILLVLLGLQILFLLVRWMYPKIQQYRDRKRARYAPVRDTMEQSAEKEDLPFHDVEASGLHH